MTDKPSVLIVGLGNPGRRYQGTRHNIGFYVVDMLASSLPSGTPRQRFDAHLLEISTNTERIILVKPQTYMNLSGTAISQVARWYRTSPGDLLVICDDLDLPFGRIRLRPGGSSGGQKGLESIVQGLGTDRFPRLRIGIGRPMQGNPVPYVLSRFNADEVQALPKIVDRAIEATLTWQREGIQTAMNLFNGLPSISVGRHSIFDS